MIDEFEPLKATASAVRERYENPPRDSVIAMIVLILKMPPEDRCELFEELPNIVCRECGQFSCIHGYSDE